ncbi:nascent polypeptide-associated complex protein [Candidatus Woesearchaeota archaeon]|nr:nascent polypeptide-associated complex protein [Candidatus Woesearchaeota archaeon]
MMPGMNPRKMQQMMKKMGIAQTELEATEVIIKCPDKEIVITEPSVAIVKAMGQEQFTISGNVEERELEAAAPEISEDDVKTVMEQANVDEEKAKEALEKAEGDIAKAIMDLQG